jgi:hypothetical protein
MEGTITLKKTVVKDRIEKELKVLRFFRQMGPEMRKLLAGKGLSLDIHAIVKVLKRLRSIETLTQEFRVVRFDATAVRKVQRQGHELEVPLVFRTKLPAKQVAGVTIRKTPTAWPIKVSTKVPYPPREALEALAKNKKKFDWMELWWIPKKVHVEEQKPDPMIVGVISVAPEVTYHFEIYRWIDEEIEDSYWAKEGY